MIHRFAVCQHAVWSMNLQSASKLCDSWTCSLPAGCVTHRLALYDLITGTVTVTSISGTRSEVTEAVTQLLFAM